MKRVGANLEASRSNAAVKGWNNPAVTALLPGLHLGYGRWPGGTTANYVGPDGTFVASGNPAEGIVKGQPRPPIAPAQWARITAAAGCANVIQPNLCTEADGRFVVDGAGMGRQVAAQMALLEGLPAGTVDYVELGNEVYRHDDPASAFYAANPNAYVDVAGQMTTAVRSSFPQARVGGCSLLDIYKGLNPQWRQIVESGLASVVDAFTYHHYFPVPAAPDGSNADALVADALADFEHAYRSTFATMPSGTTAWLTEWQYNERSAFAAAMAASPTHGLVVAALLAAHLAEPQVELTGPHATLGSGGIYSAISTGQVPALTSYGQALGAVGWLLNPVGPPPPPLPPG